MASSAATAAACGGKRTCSIGAGDLQSRFSVLNISSLSGFSVGFQPNGTWLSRKPLSPLGLPQRKCDWPATRRPPTNPSSFLAACGFGRRRREKKKKEEL